MEAIQSNLVSQGFSESAAKRISLPHAASTSNIYNSRWGTFAKWCEASKIDPFKASVPQVANFLIFMFEERKAAFKTLQGYRTAIARPIRLISGIDLAQDSIIGNLLKSFQRERPVYQNPYPKWDLLLVLHCLSRAPFEPLAEASLRNLTLKTVFLTLLAAGCRRGELHSLGHKKIAYTPGWTQITIPRIPTFVAKNQFRSSGTAAMAPLTLQAITHQLGRDLPLDRAMCPVRALKIYLARTTKLRHGKELLFVSYQAQHKVDISPQTVSAWIKKLLQQVHAEPHKDAVSFVGRTTHEVRALAASLAFTSHSGLDAVLSACSWKGSNVFLKYYLKDMTVVRDGLSALGPVVAAQQVIPPTV